MRTVAIGALALAVAAAAVFGLLTERFRYFDYEGATCASDGLNAVVELRGSFSPDAPAVRGAPYFLRIELNQRVADVAVIRPVIISTHDGLVVANIAPPNIQKTDDGRTVLLVTGLDVPYEDLVLNMSLRGGDSELALTCPMRRKYSEEIRVPLWDRLLSA
ncbi:hypothetical protein RM530_18270 [Algiphilus sp. W345]|uniref:Uncharacterized protein n=1 Tax=Banduia mediterranea TaxID=3075609 RepID=A0ABU2WPP3_9GAMM|nr:hypothetical protein [Algiphilus sp. W345]MDT0499291.1 hypothetical protein [Algiphilus sp. W345]